MNYTNPLFLIPLLVGITFIIVGFIMLKFPPKKINYLYGYRTKNSMKSQERWDFAQKYSSKLMTYCGFGLLVISLITIFITINEIAGIIIGLILPFICVAILFIKTEKAIKSNF